MIAFNEGISAAATIRRKMTPQLWQATCKEISPRIYESFSKIWPLRKYHKESRWKKVPGKKRSSAFSKQVSLFSVITSKITSRHLSILQCAGLAEN